MAVYKVEDTSLTALADAIRNKTGKVGAMTLEQMVAEIYKISGGSAMLDAYSMFVPQNVSNEWSTNSVGALNMSTAEFLELFYDGFVSAPPSGMTVAKRSIGKDESGQYDMWEYDFCPTNYSRTILLSSGMHAYELSASFGLANFIGHLYTDTGNDAFDYIRNNVRVKVIPVVNPWGFNQYPKIYPNSNGVNPNRNFDLNGEWEAFDGGGDYNEQKGQAPFSEAEAHNLARWAEANWNAEFWIDCHTGEGYNDRDLWLYYSSDSVILDRINAGISAIETWFKETYGTNCVTVRTVNSPGSIRQRWAEKIAGIPSMVLEQAPQRTTFGTAAMNEAADIANFSTNISTFVQEFLLEKYRDNGFVAVTGVTVPDVSFNGSALSVTITAEVAPSNTTQNKFEWVSSDETVVKVYGCTNKAVLVRVGTGTARISCVNRFNESIADQCTVTVEKPSQKLGAQIGTSASSVEGHIDVINTSRANRIITNRIEAVAGEALTIMSLDGYFVKAYGYTSDGYSIGEAGICGEYFETSSASGTIPEGCAYYRIALKKSDEAAFTEEELNAAVLAINGVEHALYKNIEPVEVSSSAALPMSYGGIGLDGSESGSATNRRRSDYIPIDLSRSVALILKDCKYHIVGRAYDSDKNFIEEISGQGKSFGVLYNFVPESSVTNNWISDDGIITEMPNARYVRLVIKNADESAITTVSGSVIIGDVQYNLTAAT